MLYVVRLQCWVIPLTRHVFNMNFEAPDDDHIGRSM
jgi:hypothetical protein